MAVAEGDVLIDAFPVGNYGAPIVKIGERFLVDTDVGPRAALGWSSVYKDPLSYSTYFSIFSPPSILHIAMLSTLLTIPASDPPIPYIFSDILKLFSLKPLL